MALIKLGKRQHHIAEVVTIEKSNMRCGELAQIMVCPVLITKHQVIFRIEYGSVQPKVLAGSGQWSGGSDALLNVLES